MTVVCPRPSGDPDTLLRLLASGAGEQVTILCHDGQVRLNTALLAALHTLTRSDIRQLIVLENSHSPMSNAPGTSLTVARPPGVS